MLFYQITLGWWCIDKWTDEEETDVEQDIIDWEIFERDQNFWIELPQVCGITTYSIKETTTDETNSI